MKRKESTVLLVPSIISVCVSNHVCSSCSSTFRAKIHWNVLVLSAVYRKLLNYKMINKIYFKDHCSVLSFKVLLILMHVQKWWFYYVYLEYFICMEMTWATKTPHKSQYRGYKIEMFTFLRVGMGIAKNLAI